LKKTNKYISQKYFIYWQENCCQGVSPVCVIAQVTFVWTVNFGW
jgi:hypothetical protein